MWSTLCRRAPLFLCNVWILQFLTKGWFSFWQRLVSVKPLSLSFPEIPVHQSGHWHNRLTDGHIGKVLECFQVATDLSDAGEEFLLSSWEFNPGLYFVCIWDILDTLFLTYVWHTNSFIQQCTIGCFMQWYYWQRNLFPFLLHYPTVLDLNLPQSGFV